MIISDATCKQCGDIGTRWYRDGTILRCIHCESQVNLVLPDLEERVNHPAHYGGADNTYEAIKVIEAWDLNFCLGNVVKYIARTDRKQAPIEDLKKARWYLDREISTREANQ